MYDGQFVFSQLLEFLPRRDFNACVERYRDNHKCREFFCRDQFLAMAFAQLTSRESLRDIEICLRALRTKLYHAGFRSKISRSTMGSQYSLLNERPGGPGRHVLSIGSVLGMSGPDTRAYDNFSSSSSSVSSGDSRAVEMGKSADAPTFWPCAAYELE